MNGIWCGLCSLACLALHLAFENSTQPTAYESALILFMGTATLSFSLRMWSYGMREGHFNTLNISSYLVPLLSILILMAAGKTEFKHNLLISCQLIIFGSILGTLAKWTRKKMGARRELS